MRDLTDNQRNMLNTAAAANLGVVERPYLPGFEGVTWDRNARKLCERGYLKPYVHGGYEITDDGRAVLQDEASGFGAWLSERDRGTGRARCEYFSPHETRLAREAWNAAISRGVLAADAPEPTECKDCGAKIKNGVAKCPRGGGRRCWVGQQHAAAVVAKADLRKYETAFKAAASGRVSG